MGHRKWSFGSAPAAEASLKELEREHGELYDELRASERRVMETLDENNRLDRELDEARKRIAELEAPTRVPFSDAQIERMAKAYMGVLNPGANWERADKQYHMNAIRAALAAGGLEPCAVPEYDPDDVALTPSGDEVEKLARVLCRWDAHDAPHEDSWTTTLLLDQNAYRHMARAAIAHLRPTQGHVLRDRLVEAEAKIERQRKNLRQLYEARERDARLIAELRAEVDEDNAAAASVNDLLVQVQNLTAERDAQEIELTDLRFYQREFAAVSSERDALRERASVPSDPTDDQVEALARVLRAAYMKECHVEPSDCPPNRGYLAEARAAIAHLDKRPEGLPTAEELLRVYAKNHKSIGGMQSVLAALRPWLRDPVGCDLDVTADVIDVIARSSSRQTRAKEIIDLCRKRIKPVYECKECAGMRDEVTFWKRENVASNNKMLAARAALEGE